MLHYIPVFSNQWLLVNQLEATERINHKTPNVEQLIVAMRR